MVQTHSVLFFCLIPFFLLSQEQALFWKVDIKAYLFSYIFWGQWSLSLFNKPLKAKSSLPSLFVNKILLLHSTFIYILSVAAFILQGPTWIVATETPKVQSICWLALNRKTFCQSWYGLLYGYTKYYINHIKLDASFGQLLFAIIIMSLKCAPISHLDQFLILTTKLLHWKNVCSVTSVKSVSAIPWTVARQAPLSLGFSRQEYWSGLPYPSPGDLPNPGIKPISWASPELQAGYLPTEPPEKPPVASYILYIYVRIYNLSVLSFVDGHTWFICTNQLPAASSHIQKFLSGNYYCDVFFGWSIFSSTRCRRLLTKAVRTFWVPFGSVGEFVFSYILKNTWYYQPFRKILQIW